MGFLAAVAENGVSSPFECSASACDQGNSRIFVSSTFTDIPPERDSPHEYYKLHLALSIFAQESLKPVIPQRRALMEAVSRQFSNAPLMEHEIAEIQRRLGTPGERPGDMERAKQAAHQLANMMCTALLLRGIGDTG